MLFHFVCILITLPRGRKKSRKIENRWRRVRSKGFLWQRRVGEYILGHESTDLPAGVESLLRKEVHGARDDSRDACLGLRCCQGSR